MPGDEQRCVVWFWCMGEGVLKRLANGQPTWVNPTERNDKRVWYSSSIGTEPFIAEVILERVREEAVG